MTTTALPPTAPGAAVLDAVVDAAEREARAGVDKLVAVAAWAHAHPGTPGDCASWEPGLLPEAVEREDGLDFLGGEATPAVAEFAVEQLATRLGVSTGQAMGLVADALDLAHRHPVLWAQTVAGRCPAWIARKVANACTTLPADAAAWVDTQVGEIAGHCAWAVIEGKIAYARAKWDPAQTAVDEHRAHDQRMVEVDFPTLAGQAHAEHTGQVATAALRGILDTVDAVKFEAPVAEQAAQLAREGDTDPLPIRRAKALGVIADRLLTGALDLAATDGGPNSGFETVAAGPEPAEGQPPQPPLGKSCLPAILHLHVRVEDLLAHSNGDTRLGSVEKLGPASLDLLADWLGKTDLTIKPVLDASRTDPSTASGQRAVDAHDPPEWMRELVIQRDQHCVFPWCARDARACDLDHLDPYVPIDQGGPSGQTRPANLAPLCRRHHRCKTFTRWRYRRRRDGTYEWTDPDGAGHLVDPTTGTTTPLDEPTHISTNLR